MFYGCRYNPCQNSGLCYVNQNGQPSCHCPTSTTGSYCEIKRKLKI